MATKIEWTDETWNPITGCDPVSPACDNCYARRMARRLAGRFGYPEAPNQFDVTFHPDKLDLPLRWKKPRRVFPCSMSDLFHDHVFEMKSPFETGYGYNWYGLLGSYIPYTNYPMLDAIFAVMERSPAHTFMLLTKRPENMGRYFKAVQKHKAGYAGKFSTAPTEALRYSPASRDAIYAAKNPIPKNIWVGTTVEHPDYLWRIDELLKIPAAVRFVSVEPMLAPIDIPSDYFKNICMDHCETIMQMDCESDENCLTKKKGVDWVICGPETGPGARECKPEWIEGLYEQCKVVGVPFFDKRKNYLAREFPNA